MQRKPDQPKSIESVPQYCSYADDPLSPLWTFFVDPQGRIIDMSLTSSVDRSLLSSIYPKASEEELKQIYLTKGGKQNEDWQIIQNFPVSSWFESSFTFSDENLEWNSSYSFHVSRQGFSYELNSHIFTAFGLDQLWDSQLKQFTYDETKVSNLLFNSTGVCSDQKPKIKVVRTQDEVEEKTDISKEKIEDLFGSTAKDDSEENSEKQQDDQNKTSDENQEEKLPNLKEPDKIPEKNTSSKEEKNESKVDQEQVNEEVSILEFISE